MEERLPRAKDIQEATSNASTEKQHTWESEACARAIDHQWEAKTRCLMPPRGQQGVSQLLNFLILLDYHVLVSFVHEGIYDNAELLYALLDHAN